MTDRAQSTLDFAVGVSVFLLAVAFTFAFIPGMTQPFSETVRVNPATADRVTDQLAGDTLATPGEPYRLDATCTAAFFDAGPDGDGCRFEGEGFDERLGLPYPDRATPPNVQVGLYEGASSDAEALYWDGERVAWPEDGSPASDDERLVRSTDGRTPSGSSSVVVSRRSVTVDGRDAHLRVSVW
ncbi:DUF7287 family protein [Halomarina ordinaria]|uniref:Type IV pilin n=1 Tax=Halomarina ordinaria TaxID=3033939 RepID=A0ABD5U6Z4_9EURY|nr:hypothetical protein [Halomarina sp. PSRA2]